MSMICECTVAVKKDLVEQLKKVVEKDDWAKGNTFEEIDIFPLTELPNDMVVFIFDSNGCPLLVEDWVLHNNGMFEINYLDGEGAYTQIVEDGKIVDSDKTICTLMNLEHDKLAYSN